MKQEYLARQSRINKKQRQEKIDNPESYMDTNIFEVHGDKEGALPIQLQELRVNDPEQQERNLKPNFDFLESKLTHPKNVNRKQRDQQYFGFRGQANLLEEEILIGTNESNAKKIDVKKPRGIKIEKDLRMVYDQRPKDVMTQGGTQCSVSFVDSHLKRFADREVAAHTKKNLREFQSQFRFPNFRMKYLIQQSLRQQVIDNEILHMKTHGQTGISNIRHKRDTFRLKTSMGKSRRFK